MRNVIKVTPVSEIEQIAWVSASIMRRVNDRFFICTYNVQCVKYNCWKKHAFVYVSHFKPLHQTKCCGVIVDNRADAPICVLEDKDR